MARKFYRKWKKLKKLESAKDLAKAFSKMLDTSFHNPSVMRVFKYALPREEMSFRLRAKSERLFGNISKEGGVIEDLNTINDRIRRIVEFDRRGPRTEVDPKSRIKNFDIKIVDKETVKLSFNLETTPELMFFRVDKTSSWSIFENLTRFVIRNKGRFSEGENTIILKRKGKERFSKLLSKHIFIDDWITVSLAASRNAKTWGSVTSKKIKVRVDDDESDEPSDQSDQSDQNNSRRRYDPLYLPK